MLPRAAGSCNRLKPHAALRLTGGYGVGSGGPRPLPQALGRVHRDVYCDGEKGERSRFSISLVV